MQGCVIIHTPPPPTINLNNKINRLFSPDGISSLGGLSIVIPITIKTILITTRHWFIINSFKIYCLWLNVNISFGRKNNRLQPTLNYSDAPIIFFILTPNFLHNVCHIQKICFVTTVEVFIDLCNNISIQFQPIKKNHH